MFKFSFDKKDYIQKKKEKNFFSEIEKKLQKNKKKYQNSLRDNPFQKILICEKEDFLYYIKPAKLFQKPPKVYPLYVPNDFKEYFSNLEQKLNLTKLIQKTLELDEKPLVIFYPNQIIILMSILTPQKINQPINYISLYESYLN